MSENLPAPVNPIQNLLMGMPNLPQIIQDAVPAVLPPIQYDANPFAMIGGNWKRKRIAKAKELEAQIAENALRVTNAKLGGIKAVVLFSEEVNDSLKEYTHKQKMREYEEKHQEADLIIKSLEAKKLEAETTKIGYETAIMGNEVKLGNIQFQIQELKLKEMLEEMKGNGNV